MLQILVMTSIYKILVHLEEGLGKQFKLCDKPIRKTSLLKQVSCVAVSVSPGLTSLLRGEKECTSPRTVISACLQIKQLPTGIAYPQFHTNSYLCRPREVKKILFMESQIPELVLQEEYIPQEVLQPKVHTQSPVACMHIFLIKQLQQ